MQEKFWGRSNTLKTPVRSFVSKKHTGTSNFAQPSDLFLWNQNWIGAEWITSHSLQCIWWCLAENGWGDLWQSSKARSDRGLSLHKFPFQLGTNTFCYLVIHFCHARLWICCTVNSAEFKKFSQKKISQKCRKYQMKVAKLQLILQLIFFSGKFKTSETLKAPALSIFWALRETLAILRLFLFSHNIYWILSQFFLPYLSWPVQNLARECFEVLNTKSIKLNFFSFFMLSFKLSWR